MIRVFGSINLDLVARVERLPRAGETQPGKSFETGPGGKGANQALAARRAGADVALFGAVGNDAFAAPALASLKDAGVDLGGVDAVDAPTGVALIHVDDAGENTITVIAGANARASASQVDDKALDGHTTMLLQFETPLAQSLQLARRARARGARCMLNAAPATPVGDEWLSAIDVLVVNEHEADVLGAALRLPRDGNAYAAEVAARHGIVVVITLGAQGAVAYASGARHAVPALAVQAIDTVGAGDAFVGALAASLDRGAPLATALAHASAAGALACTQRGAQASMPSADAIARAAATLESQILVTRFAPR